ncbi:hypothetical protein [Sulfuricurvum sp.]|uniref:hypothetical protein n=1 Tax=Sulfuricurvum sp. TaxID=2025608 RepID=UPI002611F51C|nr:hypothetical protein [Sulfuricurvum sp.]MDD4949632.1 hypothetical protein [Sulfuricurvum sp.]
MSILSSLGSLFGGENTHDTPDSSLIMDNFTYNDTNFIRTPTQYFTKPVYKTRWKQINSSEYNFQRSAWINSNSLKKAKTQLLLEI